MAGEAGVGQDIGEASVVHDSAVAATGYGGPGGVLTIEVPEASERQIFFIGPQQFIKLRFDPEETEVRRADDDLILAFDNNSEIVFRNFVSTAQTCPTLYVMLLDGSLLPGDLIVDRLGELDRQPEAPVPAAPRPAAGDPAASVPPAGAETDSGIGLGEAPGTEPEPGPRVDAAAAAAAVAGPVHPVPGVTLEEPGPERAEDIGPAASPAPLGEVRDGDGGLLHVAVANLVDGDGRPVAAFEVAPDRAEPPVDPAAAPGEEPAFVVVDEDAELAAAAPLETGSWEDGLGIPPAAADVRPESDPEPGEDAAPPWAEGLGDAAAVGALAADPASDPPPPTVAEASDRHRGMDAIWAGEPPVLDLQPREADAEVAAPSAGAGGLAADDRGEMEPEPAHAVDPAPSQGAQREADDQAVDRDLDTMSNHEPAGVGPEAPDAASSAGPFWVDDSVPSAASQHSVDGAAPDSTAAVAGEDGEAAVATAAEADASAFDHRLESTEAPPPPVSHGLGGTVVDDPPFTFGEADEASDFPYAGMAEDLHEDPVLWADHQVRATRPVVDPIPLEAVPGVAPPTDAAGGESFLFRLYFDGARMTAEGDRMVPRFEPADRLFFADVTDKRGEDALKLDDLAGHVMVWDDGPGGDVVLAFDGGGTLTLPGIGTGGFNDLQDLVANGYRLEVA